MPLRTKFDDMIERWEKAEADAVKAQAARQEADAAARKIQTAFRGLPSLPEAPSPSPTLGGNAYDHLAQRLAPTSKKKLKT
eukprot:217699-Prymnesium_polylepis.1